MHTRGKLSVGLRRASLACALMALLHAGAAHAFEECFLQIEGVDGGSARRGHEHAIDITAYSWEERNARAPGPGEQGGGGTGRAQIDNLHLTMRAGRASPVLMLWAANGAYARQALLECTGPNAAGAEGAIHRWALSDVTVNSFQAGWTAGQNNAGRLDQLALGFSTISYEYVPGAVKMEWDLRRHSGRLVGAGSPTQQSSASPQGTSSGQQSGGHTPPPPR